MKHFLLLSIFLASPALFAETIKDKIVAVEDGLVKFEKGRVAFLNNIIPDLEEQELIEAQLDERSTLVSFKKLSPPSLKSMESMNLISYETTRPVFETSVVPNKEEAWNIFNRFNHNYKRVSECSDRAHVWAFDELKRTGTKSMKAFIFFTNSYINSARMKWWFHVAPMYRVQVGNSAEDYVMDYMYHDRPLKVKEWTDSYVFSKQNCKVTTKFSEYDANSLSESCYMIFESMYYRLPSEIHDQEKRGLFKTSSSPFEIRTSYQTAFDE